MNQYQLIQNFISIHQLGSINVWMIYCRVNNEDDNDKDLFSPDLVLNLQNALYIELSDIYRGLCFQQKSVNYFTVLMCQTNTSIF